MQAACCIVSCRCWPDFDAYVLSESSLFVYTKKIVLKTCGTTRLLDTLTELLALADSLQMKPSRCKFSRASYLFPELQVGGHLHLPAFQIFEIPLSCWFQLMISRPHTSIILQYPMGFALLLALKLTAQHARRRLESRRDSSLHKADSHEGLGHELI